MNLNDFLSKSGKKIIITNNVSNINALIRKFSKYSHPIYNYKVITIQEIVKEILIDTSIKHKKNINIINDDKSLILFDNLINEKDYKFIPKESRSLETSKKIFDNLNQIRLGILKKDLNDDISILIDDYDSYLNKRDIYDPSRLINEALKEIKSYNQFSNSNVGYLNIEIFKGKELSLINSLSKDINEITFLNQTILNTSIYKCYGFINEVKFVASKIIKENIKLGDVNLYYSDRKYENLISAIFENSNLDFKFINNKSILSNDFVSFYDSILDFYINNLDYNFLYKIIKNKSFNLYIGDSYYNVLNNIRIRSGVANYEYFFNYYDNINSNNLTPYLISKSNKEDINHYVDFLKELVSIYKEYENIELHSFIDKILIFSLKYLNNDFNNKDDVLNTFNSIIDLYKEKKKQNLIKDLKELKKLLSFKNIKEKEDPSKINCIYFTKFDVIEREHNFFIGLASSSIIKKENPAPLIDDSYLINNLKNINLVLSTNANIDYENDFINTLKTGLETSKFYLIYSCYDSIENKDLSPSSLILKFCGNINLSKEKILQDYDDIALKDDEYYLIDNDIYSKYLTKFENVNDKEKEITISPSDIQILLSCPYKYYYSKILSLPEYKKIDIDGLHWLEANDRGSIMHKILEDYYVDGMRVSSPIDMPRLNSIMDKIKQDYKKLFYCKKEKTIDYEFNKIGNAVIDYINKNSKSFDDYIVYGREINIKNSFNPNAYFIGDNYKINFSGIIDRVDISKDSKKIRIVDYKSNGKAEDSKYYQHIIYPMGAINYIKNNDHESYNLDYFEYYFLMANVSKDDDRSLKHKDIKSSVEFNLDDTNLINKTLGNYSLGKTKIILDEINNIISNKKTKENDNCKYCTFTSICVKKLKEKN